MTVRVMDAETKAPLQGIPVRYSLSSYRVQRFILFIIPSPDPRSIYEYNIEKLYRTNSNGEVSITGNTAYIKASMKVYTEDIVVNMDVKEEHENLAKGPDRMPMLLGACFDLDGNFLENPVKAYNGSYIMTSARTSRLNYSRRNELGYLVYSDGGLNKKSELVTVYLSKRRDTEKQPPDTR